jgi:hypothetical protein
VDDDQERGLASFPLQSVVAVKQKERMYAQRHYGDHATRKANSVEAVLLASEQPPAQPKPCPELFVVSSGLIEYEGRHKQSATDRQCSHQYHKFSFRHTFDDLPF